MTGVQTCALPIFVDVYFHESPEIAEKYFVMSIPTLKLVEGEELKGNFVGAMTQDDLEDWLNDRI